MWVDQVSEGSPEMGDTFPGCNEEPPDTDEDDICNHRMQVR